MAIERYLRKEHIVLDAPWKTRDEVLAGLCEVLEQTGAIKNKKKCLEKLIEREKLGSTATDTGIAIPHARGVSDDIYIVFARTREPVDFNAENGEPCQLFFLILAPESRNDEYLSILASVARMARSKAFKSMLLQAGSPDDVIRAVSG